MVIERETAMIEQLTSARARQWGYTLATAALALLVGYDIVAADHQVPLWLGVIAVLLAITATSTAAVVVAEQRRNGTLD